MSGLHNHFCICMLHCLLLWRYKRSHHCVFKQAYNCIEELRSNAPKVSIANYIDRRALEAIHRALNIPFKEAPVTPSNGYHGYAINGDDEEEGLILDEDVATD